MALVERSKAAELADDMGGAFLAFAGHRRVEAVRPPADLHRNLRHAGDGMLKPALAEIAPRTDDIGNNVDCNRRARHGLIHGHEICQSIPRFNSRALPTMSAGKTR